LSMLSGVGAAAGAAMREYVQQAPARNTSEHADYVSYYGNELRNLVAERDAEIIQRHGYRFAA